MKRAEEYQSILNAIRILLIHIANIKYGLKEKLSNPFKENPDVETVNNILSKKYVVDFRKIKNDEELNLYESALNDYLNSTIRLIKGPEIIKDQIELLKNSKIGTKDLINKRKVVFASGIIDDYRKLKINQPRLNSWLKNVDHVSVVKNGELINYFATEKVEFRNKERIAIMQLHENNDNTISLNSILLFSYDDYKDMFAHPSRIFLKALDYYGVNIKFGSIIKRFWYHVKIPNDKYSNKLDFFELVDLKRKGACAIRFAAKFESQFVEFSFVYAINVFQYTKEFLNGEI